MNIFFDSEFTGLHQNTTLISIGLVSEGGREFYAECTDYDKTQVNQWVQENVIDKLMYTGHSSYLCAESSLTDGQNHCLQSTEFDVRDFDTIKWYLGKDRIRLVDTTENIGFALKTWLESFRKPIEMWGDVLAWDWMLFHNLVADYAEGYPNLPYYLYYIPFDLATLFKVKGVDPDVGRENFAYQDRDHLRFGASHLKHNALWDAKVIKACWERLEDG